MAAVTAVADLQMGLWISASYDQQLVIHNVKLKSVVFTISSQQPINCMAISKKYNQVCTGGIHGEVSLFKIVKIGSSIKLQHVYSHNAIGMVVSISAGLDIVYGTKQGSIVAIDIDSGRVKATSKVSLNKAVSGLIAMWGEDEIPTVLSCVVGCNKLIESRLGEGVSKLHETGEGLIINFGGGIGPIITRIDRDKIAAVSQKI